MSDRIPDSSPDMKTRDQSGAELLELATALLAGSPGLNGPGISMEAPDDENDD